MAGSDARERLLDVAEALIAESGVRGVSLRAINAAAGLSPAALHYHFGSRSELIEAILLRRVPALMERRRLLLDALEARPPEAALRGIVEALALPLVELIERDRGAGQRYVQFLARVYGDRDIDRQFVDARFGSETSRILPIAERALPHLGTSLMRLRLAIAAEAILRTLAHADRQLVDEPSAAVPELGELVSAMVDFVAAGLAAPVSARAGRAVRGRAGEAARRRPRAAARKTTIEHRPRRSPR